MCVLLAGGYFILQKINHRDGVADFRVYYDAATQWVSGNSPYGQAFGVSSGYYKYSPLALVPFALFVWMPYALAAAVYYFLVLFAFVWFSLVLVRFLEGEFAFPVHRRGVALAIITVFLADHFERELHLGNVNVFLLIAAFALFRLIQSGKEVWAGLLFAGVLLVKPHFAILIPYFFWNRNWRVLGWTSAGMLIGILLPTIFSGWEGNLNLHRQWFSTMQDHNVKLSDSPNTVYGIVNDWVLRWFGLRAGTSLVIGGLLATAAVFFVTLRRHQRCAVAPRARYIEYFTLIALIPNLAHTDTEHFMWTWPLIAYILMCLIYRSYKAKWLIVSLVVLAFIPYAVNSPDLVGRKIMLLFDEGGLLGLANLLLIALATWLFAKESKRERDSYNPDSA